MKIFEKYRAKQRLLSELWEEYTNYEKLVKIWLIAFMHEQDPQKADEYRCKMLEATGQAAQAKAAYKTAKKMKI